MSIRTKIEKAALILKNWKNVTCKSGYIFLLSHMRSRSTVLSHILGSNSQIYGYRERHKTYSNYKSVVDMRIELGTEFNASLKNKYLFDKILHNYYLDFNLMKKINPKVIFLLREPESTIKSLISLGISRNVQSYENPVQAQKIYSSRLKVLEMYAQRMKGKFFFVESDDLIDDSDNLLLSLSEWLELDEPLDRNYSTFPHTGRPGFGDPSQNITSGNLFKTSGHSDINISSEVLEAANASYVQCKELLLKNNSLYIG